MGILFLMLKFVHLVIGVLSHTPFLPSYKSVFKTYSSQQRERGERERGRERLKKRNRDRQQWDRQTPNTARQSCKPPKSSYKTRLNWFGSHFSAFCPQGLLSLKRLLCLFPILTPLWNRKTQRWEVMRWEGQPAEASITPLKQNWGGGGEKQNGKQAGSRAEWISPMRRVNVSCIYNYAWIWEPDTRIPVGRASRGKESACVVETLRGKAIKRGHLSACTPGLSGKWLCPLRVKKRKGSKKGEKGQQERQERNVEKSCASQIQFTYFKKL